MVFTRPARSLMIPKMMPPVAQPSIMTVVAYPPNFLTVSRAVSLPISSVSAASRQRTNSR